MAEHQPVSLVGIMDRLWFQQVVLSSEPASVISFKSFDGSPLMVFPKYPSCPSQTLFSTPLEDEDFLSSLPPLAHDDFSSDYSTSSTSLSKEEDYNVGSEDEGETKQKEGERHERSKSMSRSSKRRVLTKSMSFKYVGELELEEIKGFMDLGFTFRKEHMSPKMMSLVPGLKRFDSYSNKEKTSNPHEKMEDEDEEDTKFRPYLSEAWIIKRPDSPLLNLRVPKLSSDADMKKHLKFWAKSVASELQQ